MNNHIVVDFQPFVLEQKIMVYEDGECVAQASGMLDKLAEIINGFRNQYEINNITLCGNTEYLLKFKAELGLKFANDDINIDIVSR